MSYDATLNLTDDTARIRLMGELDYQAALQFQTLVEGLVKEEIGRLVLLAQELEYMASAGLRVLVFAKQKMGPKVDVYVVGAREMVRETIEKAGFDHSVYLVDTEPA